MNAFTASSCPIIAAEKIVGRAPWLSRKSAIGLLPTCAAASMQVSQSPKPQSIDARAIAGCFSTSSRMRAKLPCEAPTASLTSDGILLRKGIGAGDRVRQWRRLAPRLVASAPKCRARKDRR